MASPDPPRRPRLSLQTRPSPGPRSRSSRSLANADPKSPTAFNTLSNVYVTAIERSTPVQSTPVTAINLTQPPLKLQTNFEITQQRRIQTPYTAALPETPLSANPLSPAQQMNIVFPSTMTATPPLSAGPVESSEPRMFNFAPTGTTRQPGAPVSPVQSRRRISYAQFGPPIQAPYTRDKSLHSILRNSPLPPPSAHSPITPRRQSLRLQEKAARRVGYVSPLTQTITTELYTKSHIDLLAEDASPYTPSSVAEDSEMLLDYAMAYTGVETRDGGQTPGPFEEMRRRMAGLATQTPTTQSPRPDGIRKRKRKEKKRKWVWTIGQEEEENPRGVMSVVPVAAGGDVASRGRVSLVADAIPKPLTAVKISVEPLVSESELAADEMDVEISEPNSTTSSRATTPQSVEVDMKTPTATDVPDSRGPRTEQLGLADLVVPETGSRRDTPIPSDLSGLI